jgi:hypothetical protein
MAGQHQSQLLLQPSRHLHRLLHQLQHLRRLLLLVVA